jgi:hypothetical protein
MMDAGDVDGDLERGTGAEPPVDENDENDEATSAAAELVESSLADTRDFTQLASSFATDADRDQDVTWQEDLQNLSGAAVDADEYTIEETDHVPPQTVRPFPAPMFPTAY